MYQYLISDYFKRQIKKYLKKYPSLIDDIIETLKRFDKKTSASLGAHTYKVRFAARNLSKGKSGSFRLIIFVIEFDKIITPLVLYFKGDESTVSRKEIMYHALMVQRELEG